ncbi:hypothetical protein IFO70_25710 [Phormidium tenue FACHB-886]|nr:hypothetical protein [Phormidium tenue FACHB-886]
MNLQRWAIACYEFLFAEPGTEWREVVAQVEANCAKRRQQQMQAAAYEAWLQSLEQTAAIETADDWEDESLQLTGYSLPMQRYALLADENIEDDYDYNYEHDYDYSYDVEDEFEEDLEDEMYGLVHYHLEALGGDTFIEFSYEGDLDESRIIQALTYLWNNTPDRPNNQLTGTLRLPIAPAGLIQYSNRYSD